MPRKRIIRCSNRPYHITSRSNNKDWFSIGLEKIWPKFLWLISDGISEFKISPHCFVLMSNHYHLLLTTPLENVDTFMQFFNHRLSLFIGGQSQRINRIFGGRYKSSLIKDDSHYLQVYKYVYQNPVRAILCEKIENYPFSSFHEEKMSTILKLEINKNKNLLLPESLQGKSSELNFLNQFYSNDNVNIIRKGLRKTEYGLAADPVTKRLPIIYL